MKTTKKRLQESLWAVIGVAIYTLILSIAAFIRNIGQPLPHEMKGLLLKYSESSLHLSNGILLLSQVVLLWCAVILLRYLEESNNLFRKKSIFMLAISPLILMGSGTWFVYSPVSLFSLFFIILFSLFFRSYRSNKPERSVFYIALSLSLFSVLDADFLYLLPCLWLTMTYTKTLNPRTVWVSFLGVVLPYIYYMGVDYSLHGDLSISKIHGLSMFGFTETAFASQSSISILYWCFIAVFALFSIVNFFRYSFKERQRVRDSLMVLFWCWIASVLLLSLKCGDYAYIESLFLITSSVFICHYFSVANDRLALTLFSIFLLVLIAFPLIRIVWNI